MASPSAGIIDSQTVKAPAHGAARGDDAAEMSFGCKRHIAVDTNGRLPMVDLTPADGAYDRRQLPEKAAFLDVVVEVVRRTDSEPGFKLLPRRRVVERTFGWLTRSRRLVPDYEQHIDVSEAMSHVAMGSLLLRRISH